MRQDGIFRNDLPAGVWEALVTQVFIVADFWLLNNALTLQLKGNKAIGHYSRVFPALFYPYLTPAAQREFRS